MQYFLELRREISEKNSESEEEGQFQDLIDGCRERVGSERRCIKRRI